MSFRTGIRGRIRLCVVSVKLEGEVETHVNIDVGVEGHTLLCQLAGCVIRGNEEIEAGDFDIDDPAERRSESTHTEVCSGREALDRLDVGSQTEVCP